MSSHLYIHHSYFKCTTFVCKTYKLIKKQFSITNRGMGSLWWNKSLNKHSKYSSICTKKQMPICILVRLAQDVHIIKWANIPNIQVNEQSIVVKDHGGPRPLCCSYNTFSYIHWTIMSIIVPKFVDLDESRINEFNTTLEFKEMDIKGNHSLPINWLILSPMVSQMQDVMKILSSQIPILLQFHKNASYITMLSCHVSCTKWIKVVVASM